MVSGTRGQNRDTMVIKVTTTPIFSCLRLEVHQRRKDTLLHLCLYLRSPWEESQSMDIYGRYGSCRNKKIKLVNGVCISLLKTISTMTIFKSVATFFPSMLRRHAKTARCLLPVLFGQPCVGSDGGLMFHGPWRHST